MEMGQGQTVKPWLTVKCPLLEINGASVEYLTYQALCVPDEAIGAIKKEKNGPHVIDSVLEIIYGSVGDHCVVVQTTDQFMLHSNHRHLTEYLSGMFECVETRFYYFRQTCQEICI